FWLFGKQREDDVAHVFASILSVDFNRICKTTRRHPRQDHAQVWSFVAYARRAMVAELDSFDKQFPNSATASLVVDHIGKCAPRLRARDVGINGVGLRIV